MQKNCTHCGVSFVVTDEDRAFYQKIAPTFGGQSFPIPEPEACPDCRHARRMAFRNERQLYKAKCALTGKTVLSTYEEDSPYTIYSYDAWWSDDWDALSFGKPYDETRSFFDQFQELLTAVPRLATAIGHNENCDYCNYVNYSKDSYLCFGCHEVDHCYHNWRVHWSEYCMDSLQMNKSNLCYECIDCDECYHLLYSQDCSTCSDSAFLYDCKGCKNCLFCTGQRGKEYCMFNEQLEKDEYERRKIELQLHTRSGVQKAEQTFADFLLTVPHRPVFVTNCENVTGDHITDARNLHECYHCKRAEDGRYLESCEDIKDSMDNTFSGWPAELVFETMSAGAHCYNFLFCTTCWSCSNLIYCDSCHHSKDLFGCAGLRKKNQYCILNKQYTQEEYETLCRKIIEDMVAHGEWGKLFPQSLSPYAYNETVAQLFYPLEKEEATQRGYLWKDIEDGTQKAENTIPGDRLPETIDEVTDDMLSQAIQCKATGRLFRIASKELELYCQLELPLPQYHPDERHQRRFAKRNPRKLYERACAKCGEGMQTTYSPERPETVMCEKCYLEVVY